ncbi:hypothetical protein N7510_001440 [Penicillium lagena]|uniref:uncharacterized protein n=1 Tax=Penicillium lagena TaxID=94218 RepID=UPI0025414331|nr:uncharacterized protein N7510_001440 [Penicillium lagena]KAJ5625131.1 hypothetical protein N7510_001440 [Penicillium lagena]
MTAEVASLPQTELVTPHVIPLETSFALPRSLHTTAHLHLTFLDTCSMVFVTTTTPGDSTASAKPMGSFVYAMPDRTSPTSTISTTLYTSPSSIEYTARIAKIITRRINRPVYVGCSIDANGLGLTIEEEMAGLKKIIDSIMEQWEKRTQPN